MFTNFLLTSSLILDLSGVIFFSLEVLLKLKVSLNDFTLYKLNFCSSKMSFSSLFLKDNFVAHNSKLTVISLHLGNVIMLTFAFYYEFWDISFPITFFLLYKFVFFTLQAFRIFLIFRSGFTKLCLAVCVSFYASGCISGEIQIWVYSIFPY